MTNRAKALEALKKIIPVGEEYEEPAPTDMYNAAPFENGRVLGFARGYNAALDDVAALQDAPRVEVIDGLGKAVDNLKDVKGPWCHLIGKDMEDLYTVIKAAAAYAKLQGKGE